MVESPDVAALRSLLPGRRIAAVGRRAKWLLIGLDAGWTLAIHLRMSGNLIVRDPDEAADRHTHLVLALDNGRRIFFEDQRKFGRLRLLDAAGLADLDAAHGPEPLEDGFTPERLAQLLAGRQVKIKPLLLDQRVIAGLGNIYVSEALWLAQIHPLTAAHAIPADRVPALHAAIRQVLQQAIANQGSSLRNYRNSYGLPGTNQDHFLVYDREGAPCDRCAAPIKRIVVAQRSTFFCPLCQGRQPE